MSMVETGWRSSPSRARRSSGVGRLEHLPGTTDAEVAFVVADDHQGQGLGTRLLERLERAARPLGVTHFVADTLFSNTAMLRVLRHPHGSSERVEDGVVHVRFPIAEVLSAPGARDLRLLCSSGQIRTFDIDLNAQEHTMTTITRDPVVTKSDTRTTPVEPTVALKRRTIDSVLIAFGAVLTVVLVGGRRAAHLGKQLRRRLRRRRAVVPEHRLPARRGARGGGSHRPAVKYADESVNTGPEAEAYASFINGHLQGIADGATYADLGTPEREANAAVETAIADGADAATDRGARRRSRRHQRPAQHALQG